LTSLKEKRGREMGKKLGSSENCGGLYQGTLPQPRNKEKKVGVTARRKRVGFMNRGSRSRLRSVTPRQSRNEDQGKTELVPVGESRGRESHGLK